MAAIHKAGIWHSLPVERFPNSFLGVSVGILCHGSVSALIALCLVKPHCKIAVSSPTSIIYLRLLFDLWLLCDFP